MCILCVVTCCYVYSVCCNVLLCVFCVLCSMVAATLSLVTPAMRNHLMGALPFELGSLLGGTYGMAQHNPHFLSPFPLTSFLLPRFISLFSLFLFLLNFSPPLSPLLPFFSLSHFLSFCVCVFRSAVPPQGEGGVQHDRHPSSPLHHSTTSKQVTATLD